MKHYSPTGRRIHGRPLKRLLDTWNRNGSTSGPTARQIYDDDDSHTSGPRPFTDLVKVFRKLWDVLFLRCPEQLARNLVLFYCCAALPPPPPPPIVATSPLLITSIPCLI
jgi:hypothetical protein